MDRTAPVINDVTGNPTDWTKKAKLSVIASDSGVGGIQYKFTKLDETGNEVILQNYETENTYEVTENGKIYIYVKDNLGNESEAKIVEVTKIDSDNPKISGVDYYQGWTNQDVVVSINAYDEDSGIKEYSFDGGQNWQASEKKTYSTKTTIDENKIMVRDYTNSTTAYGSKIEILIDKGAPKINSIEINPENETEGNVKITVNAEDIGDSGILGYSFNGGEYTLTNTYEATTNGDVTIKVKDNAGNETSVVKTINNIKKFEPVVNIENNGGTYVRPTNGDVTKIKSAIEVTGVTDANIKYMLTNSAEQPSKEQFENLTGANANRVELNMQVSEIGTYYLWVAVSKDNAIKYFGSDAYEVKVSTISLSQNITDWTNQNVKVTAEYGDGLTENQLVNVNGVAAGSTTSVVLEENGTVYAEATDKAGNKVYNSIEITNIDKTNPVINEVSYNKEWTTEDVTVTINASDAGSGVAQYSWWRKLAR